MMSENGIGDLVVHLHFSDSVFWPNLDILRSESLPQLATSYSPTNGGRQEIASSAKNPAEGASIMK